MAELLGMQRGIVWEKDYPRELENPTRELNSDKRNGNEGGMEFRFIRVKYNAQSGIPSASMAKLWSDLAAALTDNLENYPGIPRTAASVRNG